MKTTEKNYQAYHEEMVKVWGKDQRMIDFCEKEASQVVMLTDGKIVRFTQPRIEKNFCFGYSTCGQGPSHEECEKEHSNFRDNQELWFMEENRRKGGYDEKVNSLKDLDNTLYLAVKYKGGENMMEWTCIEEWEKERNPCFFMNYSPSENQTADRKILISALLEEKEKHEKRLRTWWKRYGAEKLRSWTYWLDE